ncbi:MAG: hypothetical protein AAFN77_20480 [Planctomycetota bacterium]
MSENPYEPNVVTESPELGATAASRTTKLVTAGIVQFAFLGGFTMLMVLAKAQWQLMEEFAIELNPFSLAIFGFLNHLELIAFGIGLAIIGNLVFYHRLVSNQYSVVRWWYSTIGGWILLYLTLSAGVAPPLIQTITGLTD